MSLINNYVLEGQFSEDRLVVLNEHLKRGNQDVEFDDLIMVCYCSLLGDVLPEPLLGPAELPSCLALLVVVAD